MKKIKLYTDGACSGNPGCGGYAAVLVYRGIEKEITGKVENTTNNRMELLAIIKGLEALKEPCDVEVYSDSQYVVSAMNEGWLYDWQKKGWKNSQNKKVKNIDLWQRLCELNEIHKIKYIKVKGHSDDVYNNRCDKLAVLQYGISQK